MTSLHTISARNPRLLSCVQYDTLPLLKSSSIQHSTVVEPNSYVTTHNRHALTSQGNQHVFNYLWQFLGQREHGGE